MIKSYQYQLEYPKQIQVKLLKKIYETIFFNYAFREHIKSCYFIENYIHKDIIKKDIPEITKAFNDKTLNTVIDKDNIMIYKCYRPFLFNLLY
tara:strand:- start:1894 stop:2172 length:279 start_codon:yes stop_codon:yes gene_type:complete